MNNSRAQMSSKSRKYLESEESEDAPDSEQDLSVLRNRQERKSE